MSCYIVTFEVSSALTKTALKEKLKAYGVYCPIHDNAWAISTPSTAVGIRDELTPLLGPADRLFVIRSGTESAWMRPYAEANSEWLKKNL